MLEILKVIAGVYDSVSLGDKILRSIGAGLVFMLPMLIFGLISIFSDPEEKGSEKRKRGVMIVVKWLIIWFLTGVGIAWIVFIFT